MSNVIILNSDRPKTKKEQDGLGFADSAESVAKSIFNNDFSDGFVIGIEGEWGSGKTTYINFIREYLENNHHEFKILDFNPWLHSSHKNLIAAYFKLLSKEANDIFGDNSIKENLANVVDSFTPVLSNLASLGGLGDTTKSVMGLVSKKLKESPTLESQYEIIQKKLTEAKKPFLVIIDDLDRLDKAEVKTMLKLVKSVGRLPYVTYILAYDHGYVEKATSEEMPNFLEKIVQLPISLPKPVQNKLFKMLDKELEDFFKNIPNNDPRWKKIVNETFVPHISKPREIALLANAINFSFPAMSKVLDPVDFFALECLRLFDIKLWNWIRDNKDIVLGEGNYTFMQYEEQQFKEILLNALGEFNLLLPEQKSTLSLLFPRLSSPLDERDYESKELHYKTENRGAFALKTGYDAYFNQYPDENEVSKGNIDILLENSHDREKTTQTLRDWMNKDDPQKISDFLRKLTYRFIDDESPKPHPMLLWSLCDIYDDIRSLKEPISFLSTSANDQILYTFRILLKKTGKHETNVFLQSLCKDTKYIFVATYLLHWIGYFIGKNYGNDRIDEKIDLIDDSDWDAILKIIAPHIKDIFSTGSVTDFSSVVYAEFLVALIFGAEEASNLFKNLYQKSEIYTIKSIKGHLARVTSENTGKTRYEYRDVKYPELFDYSVIAKEAEKIVLEKQDEETEEAVKVFLDGVRNPLNKTPRIKNGADSRAKPTNR